MKDKFESILLQLKSNLKSDSVMDALTTEKDKKLHEKLIDVVNRYYENIDLFDKQKDTLQKLLFENANNLLENTNSTSFYLYLPNYRNYANFLVDNYYKNNQNENFETPKSDMKKIVESFSNLTSDKQIEIITNLDNYTSKIDNNIISKEEFKKRYMKLVSLLNSEKIESNLTLYTKTENKPFKLYKNSNNSIFIKAGLETRNMSLPLDKCILIIYKNEETPFKSYTDVLLPKILDNSIFNLIEKEKIKIHKKNIALISSDNPSNENDDCLNTKPDINAFAKLIAYKELKPPLAIGLFGKWGSGKSTFMDNLKRKIKELSEEKHTGEIFCKKISHIEFNAWHYSDSNLWANIMIQIFEKLNEFLVGKMPDKIENLYLELESTQKLLKEKETERTAIETKITNNKEELTNKQNQKIEKTFKLEQLKDLTKLIFEDEYIKAEFKKIREEIPYLKEKDRNSVYKLHEDFNNNYGILKKFFTLLFKEKHFRKYLLWIIVIILFIFEISKYTNFINEWFLFFTIIPFGMYWEKFNKFTSKISDFIKFYERKKSENEKDEVELTLLKEQANLESELIFLEEKISLENKRLEKISFEIEHIKSGKFLADFIMERANSNDYKQHLGLISLIRNDLEKLSEYLKKLDSTETHKIDRIVLYIDDLDRCSENKIMDVLEAIHLLLAFDLFVVIVGVDTRWIKNSLESERNLNDKNTATSTEYLEKIFQIPFHLNNMEEDVKKEQLKKLMKNDLILTDKKINNKDEDKLEENLVNNSTSTEAGNSSNDTEMHQNNSHQELKIEPFEYNYILKNANFLGETPRTIKRFVNIYRIIRSHEYILNELLTDFGTQYKYIVMFLCLNDMYDKKSDDNDKLTIDNYIQKLKNLEFDVDDINDLENFDKKDELFKFISRFSFRDCR